MKPRSFSPRGLAVVVLTLAACSAPAHLEREWRALGVEVSVELHTGTERVALATADEVEGAYRRAEALFDPTDPDNELGRLNAAAADGPYEVGEPDLYRCVKIACEWAGATDGAFDPVRAPEDLLRPWEEVVLYPEATAVRFRSPGVRLDLEGVALGYAVDMAARNFARVGLEAALLRAGPVRYAWGAPPGADAWEIPLGPFADGEQAFGAVRVRNRAVAVRSDHDGGVRGGDTLDERIEQALQGRGRSDVRAAVALADNAAEAQTASRALLAMGARRAGALLERSRRLEALLIVEGPDGDYVLASASLCGRLRVDDAAARRFGEVRFLLPPDGDC